MAMMAWAANAPLMGGECIRASVERALPRVARRERAVRSAAACKSYRTRLTFQPSDWCESGGFTLV